MQVEKAYDYLREFSGVQERNVRFAVTCGFDGDRGVYLREVADLKKPKEVAVTIEPKFMDHDGSCKCATPVKLCISIRVCTKRFSCGE